MLHPRTHLTLLAVALLLAGAACTPKKTNAELNAEKAKAFKQQQMAKAVKYYEEITTAYPDSPFAPQAKAKIQAIGPVATPAATPAHKK